MGEVIPRGKFIAKRGANRRSASANISSDARRAVVGSIAVISDRSSITKGRCLTQRRTSRHEAGAPSRPLRLAARNEREP
jgi:hypothetical protein